MSKKELTSYAHRLLNKIAKEHGFRNYSIQDIYASQPGESVAGEIFRIIISETKNDKRLKLELVCKVPPFDKQLFNELNLSAAFEREILFYSQLMPTFVKFQKEKNLSENEQFRCYPKCYGTWMDKDRGEYAIILEDLRPRGFKKVEKSKLLQLEQLNLAMIELGKFHGIAIAFQDQKPNEFSEYKKLTDLSISLCQSTSMQAAFANAFDHAIDSLKEYKHKNILRHVKSNFLQYSMDCFDAKSSDRFKVIGHGDFWHDNILYRLNQSGAAEEIQILDWATIGYVSPAYDLIHNIFNSTDKAMRDKEYKNLIGVYYDSLSQTIKLLGSDPDKLFTRENLNEELKRFGNFALIVTPLFVLSAQIQLNESNADDTVEENTEISSGLSEENQIEYDNRINGLLEDIVNLGYYRKIL